MKQQKVDAKRVLSEVQPERAFWVNNGPVFKSLNEFAQGVKKLNAAQFAHHVCKESNDFAKWVAEVIGDNVLARKLKTLKSPEAMSKAASERTVALKKLVK